jgi:membrane protein required for colicin V production
MPQAVSEALKIWSYIGLDGSLLIIGLLSGVLAMYRGMTRELLTIANWVIAAGAGYLLFNQKDLAESLAKNYGQQEKLMQIAMAIIAFLSVLIVMYLITGRIADRILDSRIGVIDRVMGFGFGVARGVLLIVIAFMFYTKFFPISKEQEAGIPNARTLPMVRNMSDGLATTLEPLVGDVMKRLGRSGDGDEQPQERGSQPRG